MSENNTRFPFLQLNDLVLCDANCVFTNYFQFHFRNVTFEQSGLIHSVFSQVYFEKCTFAETLTNYSDFSGCFFDSCVFVGRRFRQALLGQARFKNAKFEPGAQISVSFISGADFTECPDLVADNISDCSAVADDSLRFPAGKKLDTRELKPDELRERWSLSDQARWFASAGALRTLPREEALKRAKALDIGPEYLRLMGL